eukprot:2330774-Rhodomonas_salina.1
MADAVAQSRGSSVDDDLESTLDCLRLLMLDRCDYAESTLDCCQQSLHLIFSNRFHLLVAPCNGL